MLNRQEAVQAMLDSRQPAAQTEGSEQLKLRLKLGKIIEDLTLGICDYLTLTDELCMANGPYTITDWEDRDLREFENNLLGARAQLDAALAFKLRFEKSLGEQLPTPEVAQEDGPQATEEQLQDRIEWGEKLENLIIALNEFHEAESKLYEEGPHAFTRREEAVLDEFNQEVAGAEIKLSELMALKLRFEREHNL